VDDIIMVTGAASGVGLATTHLLSEKGYTVLACVRRESDVRAMAKELPYRVQPLIVDLQDQETVDNAARAAAKIVGDIGLKGLVNSAGNLYCGPLEHFPRWADQMHKRNLKPEQVAKVVLKALRARRPRIRYRVGLDSRAAAFLRWLLPETVFDKLLLWRCFLPIRFGAWSDRG